MAKRDRKRTFVLVAAVSIDGRITQGRKEGSEWTSKEDKVFFQHELNRADAVVVGRKTFFAIKRPITPRNRIVFTRTETLLKNEVCNDVVPFSGSEEKLYKLLNEKRWRRVAIVGGASIYDWFLTRGLVDEIYLTIEPVIFGAGKPFRSRWSASIARFRLASLRRINSNGTLLLHYYKTL